MDVFNRHSIYSDIKVDRVANLNEYKNIISVAYIDNDNIIIEYIPDLPSKPTENWQKYCNSKVNNDLSTNISTKAKEMPTSVKNAYSTILNSDPFGMGCSGLTLKEIYENNPNWIEKAKKELKNTFILGKMEIIENYINEG